MKKIPTLFERLYENHKIIGITDKVTPGCECVINGECTATVKWDGSCCAVINGELYKRYDAKKGKKAPAGAIPCCDPDPITGHHPHWVKCDKNNAADKWFIKAYENAFILPPKDGTYEAVGLHFQGNPYGFNRDTMVQHGIHELHDLPRKITVDSMRKYMTTLDAEGIVWWKDGEPVCKLKRSDVGLPWPIED